MIFLILFFQSPRREKIARLSWKEKLLNLDLYGTAVFLPGIVCLLLTLQWGGTTYPWNSSRVIALFAVFGVLMAAFVTIQIWKQEMATVPPRILKYRSILAAMWYAGCLGSSFLVLIYYLPIWFQAIKDASAVTSGIMSLPMVLGVVVMSIVAGGAVTLVG
jgi:hypothetical protein